jgi:pimeloyl-ACP methyl ester carboxylesterase
MKKLLICIACILSIAGLLILTSLTAKQEDEARYGDRPPMLNFQLDNKSHLEYWRWQRDPNSQPQTTWVIAGIGGPGSRITDDLVHSFVAIFDLLSPMVDQLIVVQLRGHGATNELECHEGELLDACQNRVLNEGIDPTRYHYSVYAQDLIALRKHLSIESWFIYGPSYSGRVAASMALFDEEATSGLLLDSPISMQPGQSKRTLEKYSFALYKFREACLVTRSCLGDRSDVKKRSDINNFITRFESTSTKIYGYNNTSITKYSWIQGLFTLMYAEDFDLVSQWMQLHIDHQNGFSESQVSEELLNVLKEYATMFSLSSASLVPTTKAMPYNFTQCNEATGDSTFEFLDYGVYGNETMMIHYCWPIFDYPLPNIQSSQIPIIITHKPFDPVIDQIDIDSYQTHFLNTQVCYVLKAGHTVNDDQMAQLITHLTEGNNSLPPFCLNNVDTIYQTYPPNYLESKP